MLPDGRRLGAHMPLAAGMVEAADRAHEIGATTIQIFTDNPAAWTRRDAPPRELDRFRARLREHDIAPVAIHASYLVNLAGPDPVSLEKSIALLSEELRGAPSFGARYVNAHIGSHRGLGLEAGIERLADGIARTLAAADALRATDVPDLSAGAPEAAESRPVLVLENSTGGGGGFGSTVAELAKIARALEARCVATRDVAFCVDAAHAWGAGIDMSEPDAIDDFLAAFDDEIGLSRLVMVHLNDSRSERGSRTDRHEHLGAGRIGATGLGHLLRHPRLAHAAYLIETPGMDVGYDAINLARARALALGLPLDPLPREAFDLRGSSKARTAPA